jgi:hypothetical protein
MDFSKQHLHDHRHRLPPAVTSQCVDGYFAQKKYIDEVVALKLPPITKLRPDANCRFLSTGPHPHRRGRKRKYDGKVTFHDLGRFADLGPLEERSHIHLSTALVWHVSLKHKLRVVVLVTRKDPHKPHFLVLPHPLWPWPGARWWRATGPAARSSFAFATAHSSLGSPTVRPEPQPRWIFLSMPRWQHSISHAPKTSSNSPSRVPTFSGHVLELLMHEV